MLLLLDKDKWFFANIHAFHQKLWLKIKLALAVVPWEIVINLSHVILYWSLYHSIDVLVDNGWIWTIKKAFILTHAVRSYSYKINHHNNSSSTIEFTYCVHFGDEHLKNLAFMKSAGNETITSAWQSRNLRRGIQLTNKTHWGHRADKKIFKVVGLTKKSPWGHETDTTNKKHFSLTKKETLKDI